MAMNEKDVIKSSLKIGAVIFLLFFAVGLAMHDMSYPLGYLLGYIINFIVFLITIFTSTEILKLKVSVIPVVISVYKDKTFSFITKVPPVAVLIKKALGLKSGSGKPNKEKVAKLTKEQVKAIAEQKMEDLNAASVEAAMSMVAGTARSMGVTVEE